MILTKERCKCLNGMKRAAIAWIKLYQAGNRIASIDQATSEFKKDLSDADANLGMKEDAFDLFWEICWQESLTVN